MAGRPKYVDTLAEATSVAFGPVGAAATITEETWAYRHAVADGDLAVAHFEWLLEHGSAAARVYAGFGLRDVARERGLAALDELERDESAVQHVNGCFVMDSTVGDVVRSIRGLQSEQLAPAQAGAPARVAGALLVVLPLALIGFGVYHCGSW